MIVDWSQIRSIYESSGKSVAELSEEFNIPQETIYYHIRKEGWKRKISLADRVSKTLHDELKQWSRISKTADALLEEINNSELPLQDRTTMIKEVVSVKSKTLKNIENLETNILPKLSFRKLDITNKIRLSSNTLENIKSSIEFLQESLDYLQQELIFLQKNSAERPGLDQIIAKRIDSITKLLRVYSSNIDRFNKMLEKGHHMRAFDLWREIILEVIYDLEKEIGVSVRERFVEKLKNVYKKHNIDKDITKLVEKEINNDKILNK